VFPSHSVRFIFYYLFIFKLRLTTYIKANDGDDPAYSVKPKFQGAKRPGGELTRGLNVHKSEEGG